MTQPDPSASGRQAVLERLYREHHDTVRRYLLRRTNPHDAEDLIVEVFLVVWRRLDDMPAAPEGWLCAIARNLLANAERARRRREALTIRLGGLATAPIPGPEERTAGSDADVIAALRRLSPADQEVLMLTAWDGLTGAQAAQALGCSRALYNVRLHRARRRLARLLAAGEAEGRASVQAAAPKEV